MGGITVDGIARVAATPGNKSTMTATPPAIPQLRPLGRFKLSMKFPDPSPQSIFSLEDKVLRDRLRPSPATDMVKSTEWRKGRGKRARQSRTPPAHIPALLQFPDVGTRDSAFAEKSSRLTRV
jgi:hypothetical protein